MCKKSKYSEGLKGLITCRFLLVLLLLTVQVLPQGWALEGVLDPAALQVQAVQPATSQPEVQPLKAPVPQPLTSNQFLSQGALSAPAVVEEEKSASRNLVTPTVNGEPYTSGSGSVYISGTPTLFSGTDSNPDNDTQSHQIQLSTKEYSFSYILPDADDFMFSGLKFDVPQNFSLWANRPWLAISSIPGGKQLKVEIKDINGLAAVFYANVTAEKRAYAFPLTPDVMPDGFQSTQIKEIVLVAEKSRAGESGIIDVETGGLYCPFISPAEGAAWMAPMTRPIIPASVAASPAQVSTTLTGPTGVHMQFHTSTVGWAGGGFTFDNADTPEVETVDLSDMYSQLVFALRGTESQMKLEVIDDQGRKATLVIGGIRADIDQMWALWKPRGVIDWSKVRAMYFIAEGQNKSGYLEVSLKKDAHVSYIHRDANGNIYGAEVRFPDGRIYHVTGTAQGVTIRRNDPFSWNTTYNSEVYVIPGVELKGFGLIGLVSDGFDFLLETSRLLPDGTRLKEYSVVFVPARHGMKGVSLVSAPSNPNYVFFDSTTDTPFSLKNNVPHSQGVLFLIDLRTHQQIYLASYSRTPYVGDVFTPGKYDVSADGTQVFFEVGAKSLAGTQYWIVAQSIANPDRKVFAPAGFYAAPITGLRFMGYWGVDALLQIIDRNGAIRILRINLVTGLSVWL